MPLILRTLAIPDVLLLEPEIYEDRRGYLFEAWHEASFRDAIGGDVSFVQDNQSRSSAGVIRGLHYQLPNPQGKLVRVVAGGAFVVAVDLRSGAPTFGKWVSEVLTAANRLQMWVPAGFAHGFMSMADTTDMIYKVTAFFAPDCSRRIRWDDPDIGIEWPSTSTAPILSLQDRDAMAFRDAEVYD